MSSGSQSSCLKGPSITPCISLLLINPLPSPSPHRFPLLKLGAMQETLPRPSTHSFAPSPSTPFPLLLHTYSLAFVLPSPCLSSCLPPPPPSNVLTILSPLLSSQRLASCPLCLRCFCSVLCPPQSIAPRSLLSLCSVQPPPPSLGSHGLPCC